MSFTRASCWNEVVVYKVLEVGKITGWADHARSLRSVHRGRISLRWRLLFDSFLHVSCNIGSIYEAMMLLLHLKTPVVQLPCGDPLVCTDCTEHEHSQAVSPVDGYGIRNGGVLCGGQWTLTAGLGDAGEGTARVSMRP